MIALPPRWDGSPQAHPRRVSYVIVYGPPRARRYRLANVVRRWLGWPEIVDVIAIMDEMTGPTTVTIRWKADGTFTWH